MTTKKSAAYLKSKRIKHQPERRSIDIKWDGQCYEVTIREAFARNQLPLRIEKDLWLK